MIKPNANTNDSESPTEIEGGCKTKNDSEIIYTTQTLVITEEDDNNINKESDHTKSLQSNNNDRSTSVSQATTIDIETESTNALVHPKKWLIKYLLRHSKHIPNHEFPPGHPLRYTHEDFPQQAYSPQGYPSQCYPPQGYDQQVFLQRNAEPKSGGGPFKSWFQSNQEEDELPIPYDPETRNQFIRKILTIVLVMLIFTSGFVALVLLEPSMRKTFRMLAMILMPTASVIVLILSYAVSCSPCTKRAPWSYIVLVLTTIAMSVLSACVSSRYKTEIVLYAVAATAGVVIVCLGLACTKFDFTKWLLFVIVISVGVSIVGIIVLVSMKVTGQQMKTVHLVILIIVVILLTVGLVIEIQMIIGGKSIQLEDDEYAMGAFMVYTSIVHIFISLVQILGLIND